MKDIVRKVREEEMTAQATTASVSFFFQAYPVTRFTYDNIQF